jgi:ribosome-binding protein aMBF1 (putative translation factor)
MAITTIERAHAEVIERIRAAVSAKAITKGELAKKAKLHPNTLIGIEDAGWNPTAATLIALERHLPKAPAEARAA